MGQTAQSVPMSEGIESNAHIGTMSVAAAVAARWCLSMPPLPQAANSTVLFGTLAVHSGTLRYSFSSGMPKQHTGTSSGPPPWTGDLSGP
jgi:hypothetical protein